VTPRFLPSGSDGSERRQVVVHPPRGRCLGLAAIPEDLARRGYCAHLSAGCRGSGPSVALHRSESRGGSGARRGGWARAEAQRQQSEFDRVVKERDQSRGRAAEAESRAETLAADLAVAQVTASEQRARAGGTPWPSSVFVPACFLCLCLRSFFWLFAELEFALDESAKALAEALARAAEQREADHAAMSEAVSDVYRVLGSSDVPSGSSPQSRLQVLGDHVRSRLREALHHGVKRAFAVLASHYVVDLERVSEGYCLPDKDEAALAEVQRLDAAAAGLSAVLATTFEAEILPPAPSSEAGMDFAEGGDGAEGAAPSQGDA
jgi:hypothetical protein